MRILLIAPWFNKNVPGEAWSTYKWVEGISAKCSTTVLTTHKKEWLPNDSPTTANNIVNWIDPDIPGLRGPLDWGVKPGYILFYLRARSWIKDALRAGKRFDLVHQINPLALRYPCPARGLGIPYIMGPLAGSLPTPVGFRGEANETRWFLKLRKLDHFRLRYDPLLRGSYSGAAAILGVAPYVEEFLSVTGVKRVEIASETGVECVSQVPKLPPPPEQPLRLLFVGRIVRTKGILDGIRAVAEASKKCSLIFDVIGEGDLLAFCKQEVSRLNLEKIVRFHGRLPRFQVNEWYARSDVFLFPSFREPSGNVVFEAMSHSLPVITTAVGGPGFVVDNTCGIRVELHDAKRFVYELASAITRLAANRALIEKMSAAALSRILSVAHWPGKIQWLISLYTDVLKHSKSSNPQPDKNGTNAAL